MNDNVFIKNIYYMLSYAFSELRKREYQDIAAEEFDNAHNLFAAILTRGIGRQLKQGLYREYVGHLDELAMVRGKINMPGTANLRMARQTNVVCEFDELSPNNILNQIVKTTALLFLDHQNVEAKYRNLLKKQLLFFVDIDRLEIATVQWSALRFQRHNQSYRTLIGICQLIAEGLLLSSEKGQTKLASFLDDQRMSRLFERFVLEYYKQHHPGLRPNASQIPWSLDDDMRTMLPKMQTDITLQHGEAMLIIDTKYYSSTTQFHFGSHKVHSGHLYQIFTYVKNAEANLGDQPGEVSGMLLYARTQADIQPEQTYRMSGNKINVSTLDLNQEFANITAQLDAKAEEHFATQGQ